MEFRELKSLSIIAVNGSITETARQMNLTPAAVHKQLKQLESELGTLIYEKRNGKLELTSAGEVLLPYFRDMLSQYDNSIHALEEWQGTRRGLVRIGSGPSLANYLLPPILREFHDKWPQVEVDVQTGNSLQLIESLKHGDLDVVLVVARESAEDRSIRLAMELSFEIPLVSCLPGIPQRCTLSELGSVPFILFRRGARIENLIDEYLASHRLVPNVIMRFDSAEAIKAVILSGLGVAMLPSYAVAREIASGELHRINHREKPLTMLSRVLVRNARFTPPAVTAFLSVLQSSRARPVRKVAARASTTEKGLARRAPL